MSVRNFTVLGKEKDRIRDGGIIWENKEKMIYAQYESSLKNRNKKMDRQGRVDQW